MTAIGLSVIAPALNEQENVAPLVGEVEAAIAPLALAWELLVVDDGSTDETLPRLRGLLAAHPNLRVLTISDGSRHSQAIALRAGIRASLGAIVAMLDADLQNDPRDIPRLLDILRSTGADLVQGDRTRSRCDGRARALASRVGRTARRVLLGDLIRDTGCTLRVMRREVAESLPLDIDGLHRFIPISAVQLGFTVVEAPVGHRPRRSGHTKYGSLGRALPGLADCIIVRWMRRRRRVPRCEEIITSPGATCEELLSGADR